MSSVDGSTEVEILEPVSEETPDETSSVSETDEADQDGQSDSDSEDTDQDGADETKKPKVGFERRVKKLNARIAEKESELAYWKEKALGSTQPPPQIQAPNKPRLSDYNDIEAYTEALTDWKIQAQVPAYQRAQENARAQQLVAESYTSRLEAFTKDHPDFDEVLEEVSHVPIAPDVVHAIRESDVGPAITYELATNVEEAERIARLSPARQLVEIGKIEARLSSPGQKPGKQVSRAPAPISQIRKGGSVRSVNLADPDLPFEDFVKARNAQLKARNR